jgi:hypothetical protein
MDFMGGPIAAKVCEQFVSKPSFGISNSFVGFVENHRAFAPKDTGALFQAWENCAWFRRGTKLA